MAEELRLKLDRKTVSVVLEDESGTEHNYTLKELSGAERNTYLNKMTGRVKMVNGQAQGIKSFDGFQADLLRISLFNDDDEPVSVDEIEALPSSTQQALFDKAQELSGLNAEPDSAKND